MPNYWYDHIHLVSPDPEKAAQYYERMFGAKVVGRKQWSGGRTGIQLDFSGAKVQVADRKVQLESAPTPTGTVFCHFAIRTDDKEAAVDELKAKGAKFVLEDKFLLGPDNVLIELTEKKLK